MSGNDLVYAGAGNDIINGGTGEDKLYGEAGDDTINGGTGNDNLQGGSGNDTIDGGVGNDNLYGNIGSDTYIFSIGGGEDTVFELRGQNNDIDSISILGDLTIDDIHITRNTNDLFIEVISTEDRLIVNNYYFGNEIEALEFLSDGLVFDQASIEEQANTGTIYNDFIVGIDGGDTLNALAGNDQVYGSAGDDSLQGGTGDDFLSGGIGSDTYIFNLGDGIDIIYDYDLNINHVDRLEFGSEILVEDIQVLSVGRDLQININESDYVIIQNWYQSYSRKIEEFEFADGTILNVIQIEEKATISGGSEADILYATKGDDVIEGNEGNDSLYGYNNYSGLGNDKYVFDFGDGQDIIYDYDLSENNLDIIEFSTNIGVDDVSIIRSHAYLNDLLVIYSEDDFVRIKNWYENASYQVEELRFLSDVDLVWDLSDMASNLAISGTLEDDYIRGTNDDDRLLGLAGDDTINATIGNDQLSGGNGNDTLIGGAGDDTYIYGLGDGSDSIRETSGNDKIVFGEGINQNNLYFFVERSYSSNSIDDFVIRFLEDSNDMITVEDYFIENSSLGRVVELLEFSDGTTLDISNLDDLTFTYHTNLGEGVENFGIVTSEYNDIVYGTGEDDYIQARAGNDRIIGGDGDDRLYGGQGDDVYVYALGDGNDRISDTSGTNNIEFAEGISKDSIYFTKANNQFVINFIASSSDSISLGFGQLSSSSTVIKNLIFSDGMSLRIDGVNVLSFKYEGTDGDDLINNIASGGTTYIYTYAGNDNIRASSTADIINAGTGDDQITGGQGDDTYIYNLGDGSDTIDEDNRGVSPTDYGNDKVLFGEGINKEDIYFSLLNTGQNLVISHRVNVGDVIVIDSQFNGLSDRVESLEFSDGTILDISDRGNLTYEYYGTEDNDNLSAYYYSTDSLLYGYGGNDSLSATNGGNDQLFGGSGNDILFGRAGNDRLIGGSGDDRLYGGEGDDVYVYGLGDGNDSISDTYGTNKIEFTEGIDIDDIYLSLLDNGRDLMISHRNNIGDIITIEAQFHLSENSIDSLVFIDGTILDISDRANLTYEYYGTEENDNLRAYSFSNDSLLYGYGGNDNINATNGNDQLSGGNGNDILRGGAGDDTYIYGLGDGSDNIHDTGGNDKIVFSEGINQNNLYYLVEQDSSNSYSIDELIIKFSVQSNDGITIVDNRIELLEFSDGTTLDISSLDDLTFTYHTNLGEGVESYGIVTSEYNDLVYGTGEDDYIQARAGNDRIIGGDGDDRLYGGQGDDVYVYALGDGNDRISDTSGTNNIEFAEGISKDSIYFTKANN